MTREIIIRPVLNGYVAQVGCQHVCFTDKQTMLTALSEYYDKPEEVEKRWLERAVNKMSEAPRPADCGNIACGDPVGLTPRR